MIPVSSNAKNFASYINTGVDPRTGTISYTLEIAEFVSPQFKFNLMYEQTTLDNSGFGIGNRLMLSKVYEPVRGSLALELSTGASYFIKRIIENKKTGFYNYYCDDIHLIRKSGFYYIYYIDGRIEKISVPTGLLDSISYPDGKKLKFNWNRERGKYLLVEINNSEGAGLSFVYETRKITSTMRVNGIKFYFKTFILQSFKSMNILTKIQFDSGEISFGYLNDSEKLPYLNAVVDELKLSLKITYGEALSVPEGYPNTVTPITEAKYFDPFTKKEKVILYEYDPDNNYTGFGGYLRYELNSKYDPMADGVRESFLYYTVEILKIINKRRKVKRTYNKYHFLIKEEFFVQSNGRDIIYQENSYAYASNFEFPISGQPKNFGKLVKKKIAYKKGNQTEILLFESYTHDSFGNLIKEVYTDGRYKECNYYLASGESGCPPSDNGMITYIRNIRMYTKEGTPKSSEYFNYSKVAHDALLILVSEKGLVYHFPSGEPSVLWKYGYHKNPLDIFTFGKVAKEETYLEKRLVLTKDYTYQKTSSTYTILISTFNGSDRYNESSEYRLVDNKIVLFDTEGSRVISFRYRLNGELINKKETFSNTLFSSETYNKNQDGQNSFGIVNGRMHNVKIYNSYGFLHKELLKNEKNELEVTAIYVYDEFMNLVQKNLFDTCNGTKVSSLLKYEYDNYQNISRIIYPSGMISEITNDFIAKTITTTSGNSREILHYNDTLNIIKKEIKLKQNLSSFLETYSYDFFDNLISSDYLSGDDKVDYKVESEFDNFNRLIKKVTSSRGNISLTEKTIYFSDTTDNKPIRFLINDSVVGSRTYDGIGRILTETRQDSVKTYRYSNGFNPIKVNFNANQAVDYEYVFNNQICSEKGKDAHNRFEYQLDNIILLENDRVKQTNEYDSKNRIQRINIHCSELDIIESFSYTYSTIGRILSLQRQNGYLETYSYNSIGLLSGVELYSYSLKGAKSNIQYSLSDKPSILTLDNVKVIISYDDSDREKSRLMKVGNRDIMEYTYIYDAFDRKINIECRYGNKTHTEKYTYDSMSRLIEYISSGELNPVDETGKEIVSQKFEYDVYNNIKSIQSGYSNHSKKTENYIYDPVKKQTLISITSVEENKTKNIEYDLNGSVVNDSFASYTYNSLNQMSSCVVHSPQDPSLKECEYVYDASKKLVLKDMKKRKEFYIYADGDSVKNIIFFNEEEKRISEIIYSYVYNAVIRTSEFFIDEGVEKIDILLCDYKGTPVCNVDPSGRFNIFRRNTPYGSGDKRNV